MTVLHILITILLGLAITSEGRQVRFKNSCSFVIDVEATPGGVVCGNLNRGASCAWNIPAKGFEGHFHRRNREGNNLGFPSGTLAEFKLASTAGGQWNWDWFDISIIPPGCPGTIRSYEGCWCNGGSDGYDVGMRITPVRCRDKQRTCLNRKCSDAYGYPKDDTKTTVCQDIGGDFEIEFCPPGSHSDLGTSQLSQTPPCRGGPSVIVPPKGGSPPAAPRPPTSAPRPPTSAPRPPSPPPKPQNHCSKPCVRGGFAGTCTSNCPPCYIPAGSGWNCFEKTNGACPAWAGMTDCSAGGRKVAANGDESATFNNQNSSTATGNTTDVTLLAVLIVVAVVILLFFIIGTVVNIKLLSSPKISERV